PEQAAQIIRPPALTLDVVMPPLPQTIIAAAQIIAAAAPAELSAEIARTLLTLPAPVIQQAPALLPTAPPQTVTEQLVDTLLRLNQPQPIAAPLLTAPTTLPAPTIPAAQITLEPLALPRATQAFVMALPENFIQAAAPAVTTQGAAIPLLSSPLLNTPLLTTTTPPASSGLIAPKMDAQILQIDTPIVKIGPPVIPGAPVTTTPTITPTMPAVAGALQGEVRGITAQNFPVLSLNFPALNALQDFIMQFPADNMPPGAPVTIMPQPGTATPGTAAVAAAGFTPLPEFFTSGLWPAFDEAFQALQQAAPQAAQLLAQTSIPNAASPLRMPAVMMMFMAAMKGGDLQSWLGEKTVDTLRRIGKADVLARLTRDSGTLSRLSATEPATPQDWRSTALPIMWDNHVHKMFLHVRHDREQGKDGQEGQKNGTRFILDIQPPRMGDVQLDGLHRPGENAGRLDMIIRTKKQLSPTMQQAMRRLYINALDQTAMSGELSFQGKEEGWVKVG
ncbi:MAG: hypothetical protein KKA05_00485, partial [Alphaproteobacteria bacterium]|nr:hypothetical protein [Alphaproteobacteria bacterium]